MRAPLLAILIVAVGAFAYLLTQRLAAESAAAEEAVSVSATDGAALAIFNEVCIEGRESFAQTESRAFASGWTQAMSGIPVNGCYIYDFDVSGLLERSDLESSRGEPSERTSQPGVVDAKKWVRPAPFPTVATLRMGYFPVGSPAVEQVGFSGLVLALTSMSR